MDVLKKIFISNVFKMIIKGRFRLLSLEPIGNIIEIDL